jgi:3-oxoacyl-[acyl-carrier protein] reductase
MKNNLTGKIALITGASRGIGDAIIIALGKQGATVIGTATTKKGVENIDNKLKKLNIKGSSVILDVKEESQIVTVTKNIIDNYGKIDILVNNAGIVRDNLLMRMSFDEWDDVINTNLSSVYKMSKAVLRSMMKQRSGRIISISSVIGATGNAGQTNYAATKAGIIGFTKSLAREVGARGITVNAVAPGFIETDMTEKLPSEYKKELTGQIPLNKIGSVDDIANAVLFLASDSACYITAQTIHVNGGLYAS